MGAYMSRIKFEEVNVKGHNFTAIVWLADLDADVLKALHLDGPDVGTDRVKVEGEFSVYAPHDDECSVDYLAVTLIGALNGKTYWGPTGKMEKWRDERGMQCVKSIWDNIPASYLYEAEEDSRFDIDGLVEQISEQLDAHEEYYEQARGRAEYLMED